MDVAGLLLELYGRLPPVAHAAVDGASPEALRSAPADGANTLAWLVWHAARVEDHHVAELLEVDQLFAHPAWSSRFGLEPDPSNTGYGHTAAEVRAVAPRDAADLTAYLDAVHARTAAWLATLRDGDLDRVVDRRWDPPVTLGVRLVSIADDGLQHLGQACYVRGLTSA